MYQTQIQKWGNSQAIRLPKIILESASLKVDEEVQIEVKEGEIIIKKAKPKTFAELVKGFEGKYEYKEWDTGNPVGKEVL